MPDVPADIRPNQLFRRLGQAEQAAHGVVDVQDAAPFVLHEHAHVDVVDEDSQLGRLDAQVVRGAHLGSHISPHPDKGSDPGERGNDPRDERALHDITGPRRMCNILKNERPTKDGLRRQAGRRSDGSPIPG